MRCLYCGIRLKIVEKAQAIEYCPECSVRIEHETSRAPLLRAAARASAQANGNSRQSGFASLERA